MVAEVAVGAAVLYVAMCGLLFFGQSKQVYFPGRTVHATPEDAGLSFESLRLKTPDGETLAGWFIPGPTNVPAAGYTVLVCHGNAGDIGDRVYLARLLHDMGFGSLMFDYRGYGQSSGRPTEEGTYADASRVWEHLTVERKIAPDRIVLYGHSLGGVVAIHLAQSVRPAPRLLVAESVFSSAPDMAARIYPWLPGRALCRFRYNAAELIHNVECPVILAHSPDDEVIPYDLGRRVFDAAKGPKRFFQLTGGHNTGGLHVEPVYQRMIADAAVGGGAFFTRTGEGR
jgi:fermentation-respiration switch protein FrsA (DUF1100 family)